MDEFKVSVIIPVYNAVKYVEEAVKSVVNFPQVGEVILVEDGCKDGGYQKCIQLSFEYSIVRTLIHPNRKNLGPSASRNLGIIESRFPYISFLDADDYCLPNRFLEFESILENKVSFDGLYEAVQYFNGSEKIYGISKVIPPEDLLYFLIRGTYGHFHTNGLIVKKEILLKAGLFVNSLELHQDSDLWLKLAFYGKLISGKPGIPVAMVRNHDGNRIWNGISSKSRYKQLSVTWNWAKSEPIGLINKLLILKKILGYKIGMLINK